MLSWLADIIQIALSSESFWKATTLLAAGYFGYQIFEQLKAIRDQFLLTSKALVKNGKPIAVAEELAAFAAAQQQCFLNQAKCMELQCEFREEPWRFCEKFTNCPAVQSKAQMVAHIETALDGYLTDDMSYREEINKHIASAFETAAQDRKRIEDMILKNREIFTTFTQELGREVIRAIGKGLHQAAHGGGHDN
jgi:hypothetical protein